MDKADLLERIDKQIEENRALEERLMKLEGKIKTLKVLYIDNKSPDRHFNQGILAVY